MPLDQQDEQTLIWTRASNASMCGALILGPAEAATEITVEAIGFGRTRYYRKEMRGSVLVWAFGQGA